MWNQKQVEKPENTPLPDSVWNTDASEENELHALILTSPKWFSYLGPAISFNQTEGEKQGKS